MLFNEFILSFPTCSVISDSVSAKYIYENIIWNDINRIKMVEFADAGITPLSACVEEIENYCNNNPSNDINLNNNLIKQTIGRMVAVSLAPLGYTVLKKGRINNKNTTYFKNASHFEYTGGEKQHIVKYIEDINV